MSTRDRSSSCTSSCSSSPRSRRGFLLPRGSCLGLRGRTWTYRRTVPPDLQVVLGRSEIVRSLHTGDLGRAEKLAGALDVIEYYAEDYSITSESRWCRKSRKGSWKQRGLTWAPSVIEQAGGAPGAQPRLADAR